MPHRILVVEDSRTQAAQIAELLAGAGYLVSVCHDGDAALAACERSRFDAVLCDIVMPGTDGYAVCRRIREKPPLSQPAVVLMTALADPADVVRALAAGADNFITKPFSAEQLTARLARALAPRRDPDGARTVTFLGNTYALADAPHRTLDLLLSSLEAMAERNRDLEESRAAAERALDQARHAVAARDEVLAVVSHDLRSPLNTVSMAAQLAASDLARAACPGAEPAQRRLATISRSVDRMARLLRDLLDVTRIESDAIVLEPEDVSLHTLFEDAVQAHRPLAEVRNITLSTELDDGDLTVRADPERLAQVLANLVGNALKFTHEGGRVTLQAWREPGQIHLAVRDTGSGIAPDEVPRVFDRFWQARRTARLGTGLGLPIVKGLVEAHAGRVWVESALCVGTTMHVTLPA